ncbi:MAG: 50S ribosomal protein L10 [Paracoccaceae bacterium]
MDRARKEQVVSELKDVFKHSGIIVAANYTGITVAEMSDLRNKMRENSANVRVAKNRLARIAIEKSPPEGMKHLLVDQIVLMYSEDPVTAAKISVEFAKTNNNLKIVGGAMGDRILDSDGVTEVSKLPTREEVLSSISALLVAPAGGLASSLTGPASVIAGVLENIGEN